jgi:hypothetical protein
MFQKTELFITTAVRTSNPTNSCCPSLIGCSPAGNKIAIFLTPKPKPVKVTC